MTKRSRAILAAILAGTLALASCSQSQVTVTLDLVVTAADVAVSTLQSTGALPPGTATVIQGYLGSVTTAVSFATTELASADTGAVKASKIAAEFAMLAVPNLPAGTPQVIGETLQAVASAIANFLATLPTVAGTGPLVAKADGTAAPTKAQVKIAQGQLDKIAGHNAKVRAKLGLK